MYFKHFKHNVEQKSKKTVNNTVQYYWSSYTLLFSVHDIDFQIFRLKSGQKFKSQLQDSLHFEAKIIIWLSFSQN